MKIQPQWVVTPGKQTNKVLWLLQPKNYRAVKRNDRGLLASAISPPQGLYYYSFFVAYFETPSVSQIYVGSYAYHKIHFKNSELIIIIIIIIIIFIMK